MSPMHLLGRIFCKCRKKRQLEDLQKALTEKQEAINEFLRVNAELNKPMLESYFGTNKGCNNS